MNVMQIFYVNILKIVFMSLYVTEFKRMKTYYIFAQRCLIH